MSSLRVPIFENSKFVAETYFIFLKTSARSNFKYFQYQIWTSVTLILDWNYVKGLRPTKIVKQIKFEGAWGELEAKYYFQRQSCPKIYETNFSVSVKYRTTGKV